MNKVSALEWIYLFFVLIGFTGVGYLLGSLYPLKQRKKTLFHELFFEGIVEDKGEEEKELDSMFIDALEREEELENRKERREALEQRKESNNGP